MVTVKVYKLFTYKKEIDLVFHVELSHSLFVQLTTKKQRP